MMGNVSLVIQIEAVMIQFINGLSIASIYLLMALGLTVIFGIMDVVNFAHGAMFMLGAMIAFTTVQVTSSFWLALVAAAISLALAGVIIDVLLVRPLNGREPIYTFLLTFGLSLFLEDLASIIWGIETKSISAPITGIVQFGPIIYPQYRLFIILMSILLLIPTVLLITRSRFGVYIRATIQNDTIASAIGLNTSRLRTATFAIGAALAGISGAIMAVQQPIEPSMGTNLLIIAFIIVVIGGLGSIRGTVIASLFVGEFIALSQLFISSRMAEILLFIMFIAILLVRPHGLYGVSTHG